MRSTSNLTDLRKRSTLYGHMKLLDALNYLSLGPRQKKDYSFLAKGVGQGALVC